MTKHKNTFSRRSFIGQSCAAVGYTTLFSSLINLKAMGAAAVDNSSNSSSEYKALVCILLAGGNDSYNMLVPYDDLRHGHYTTTRGNIAIPQSELLQIFPTVDDGGLYGVHPSMPEVQSLFNSGKLSFLSNVGTLVQPTTKTQYQNDQVGLPLGLFSHSDQIKHWQTGRPTERTGIGWGGRVADLTQSMNGNSNVSMNISLSGSNTFQVGENVNEYVINKNGVVNLNFNGGNAAVRAVKEAAVADMLEQAYGDIYLDTYRNTMAAGKEAGVEFQTGLDEAGDLITVFSDNDVSANLRMVARSIKAAEGMGFARQTYFITYGGWDHHDNLLAEQGAKLPVLSKALSEFNTAMEEIGKEDNVTTFTISDFARTLTNNGDGTDHAWGGNAMIMGGAVNGGKIFGSYPNMELGNEIELGSGRLIPTTAADEYLAELARWFGVSGSDLNMIFPNLSNFYDTASLEAPIGFLNL